MKKTWLLVSLCTVVGVGLMAGVVLLAQTFVEKRKEAEARRQHETEARLRRQREAERREARMAFTDPQPPTADEAAEFVEVLTQFSDAMRAENAQALARLFDGERFFDELVFQGGPSRQRRTTPADRAAFARAFEAGARQMITNPLVQWDTTIIRRIRWSTDRNEAVVIGTHRQHLKVDGVEFPIAIKMRWWFIRRPAGWRIYDFEQLDTSMRITRIVGELENLPRVGELREATVGLNEAISALLSGDMELFDDGLARARRFPFPPRMAAVIDSIEAAGHMSRGDAKAALKLVERAEKLNPDMPGLIYIRMSCCNLLADYESALKAADEYVAQLGGDSELYTERGIALEGLGRDEEAAADSRKALDDYAGETNALDGLRRVLRKEKLPELGERLAKAPSPERMYDELVNLAYQDDDDNAIAVYNSVLRKLLPNDPRGITWYIRNLVADKRFAEAEAEMKSGLDRVAADKQDWVMNAYCSRCKTRTAPSRGTKPSQHREPRPRS
jgi:tetratricopeptide (TPR) repeat protein